MLNDDNAYNLKIRFIDFRNLAQTMPKDEYQKHIINSNLDFSLFTGNIYEQNFKNMPLIEGLSLLSGIERNVRITEFEILNTVE